MAMYLPMVLSAQSVFNSGTVFSLGQQTTFSSGGNTFFRGRLENQGTLVAKSNVDFFDNRDIGNLRLSGAGDQEINGDTLLITNLEVEKTGDVQLLTAQIFVSGSLNVISGVIKTGDIDDLIVTGQSSESGAGFVEGKLVGLSSGNPVSFPMGVNGFRNAITFSGTDPGIRLVVDCVVPEPSSLLPTEEMVGIADEVEWRVQTLSDSTRATLTANFSGLDFINFSNGQSINANRYAPALAIIQEGDTIYTALNSSEATPENSASDQTSGRIVSTSTITIDTTITRINVAWLPFIDGPEFFVPNVFSPEGFLEENRIFRPFFAGAEVSNLNIRVFNTFNAEVYSVSETGADLDLSLIGWDGKLRGGQPAEEGVYYYSIQLVAGGQVYEKTSSVLLVK
ncbi:MAG: gliding motility-associated C-terminal domain-containing protein [Bacteroidota bacterium]